MQPEEEEMLNISCAARLAGVDPKTVRHYLDAGNLEYTVTSDGFRLVRKSDIQKVKWRRVGKPAAVELPNPRSLHMLPVSFEFGKPTKHLTRIESACRDFHKEILLATSTGKGTPSHFYRNLTTYRKKYDYTETPERVRNIGRIPQPYTKSIPSMMLRGVIRFYSQYPLRLLPGIPLYEKGCYKSLPGNKIRLEGLYSDITLPIAKPPLFLFDHTGDWMVLFEP
jgi:hypothetical protein